MVENICFFVFGVFELCEVYWDIVFGVLDGEVFLGFSIIIVGVGEVLL